MSDAPAPPAGPEPIAIVGIGCRYADVRGPDEFYEIVRQRRNTVRDAPEHRIALGYDIDHFYDPRPRIPGKISSKKGGFLEHPELFDPEAFGIAPRDALTMEPQQRLMIEVTWDALDDAGIPVESIAGERCAVILGYMAEDYSRERAGVLGEAAVYRGHDVFTVGGMSHAVLSGRISFLLGVTGPSLTLDTACSSSLYAAHLACESLRRGESKLAIAGGANLFLSPEGNIALSRSGMLSLSGACKAFDASADGFVRAEGAGVVVLRPLSDAIAAGNPIYAVIRGSGISADGRDGGHMMAPGRKGQAQAMRDAYHMAGISPADVHYVETHGTGTMIGDPVEIGALADVMGPGRDPQRKLRVASIKGNLGHTESASGVAGLINACLAIRHRTLPPQLHFETPNPMIPWAEMPIEVQRDAEPWPFPEPPLIGVNSFGISGTNAHFVLEAPPEASGRTRANVSASASERTAAALGPVLIPLSAHDPNALHEMAEKLRDRIAADPTLDLRDLAYTLARRRSSRTHRIALVAASLDEAREALDAYLAGEASPCLRVGVAGASPASLVMVFPGQGSQWLGMGRGLLEREPVFAAAIDRIDAAYREHVAWSLRAVLLGKEPEAGGVGADWTRRLDVLQPVLVAVEVALARFWQHVGIAPTRVLGQSMGEIAAAHVAGALSLADLARLACQRGLVVARAAGRGTMAVVSLGREAVATRLADWPAGVEIAGVNSPSTTILSGDSRAVVAAVEAFEAEGVFARRLEVDFASHCFHMDPLIEPFRRAIGDVEARPCGLAFDSTVDGETKRGDDLDAGYWLRNLREPVAFDRGLAASLAGGGEIFLEVSPHPTLPRAIDETAQSLGHTARYVPSLRRLEDEQKSLLVSLAELFVRGQRLDWAALHPHGRVVELPLYAYQRKRYFFSTRSRLDGFRPKHPLLGQRADSSLDPRLHSWDFPLDVDSGSFVAEGRNAPDSLFVELALAAADALWPGRPVRIDDLVPHRPLARAGEGRRAVQVVVREESEGRGELRVASRLAGSDEPWQLHATGRLVASTAAASDVPSGVEALVREGNTSAGLDEFHAALERCGLAPGSAGRVLRELEIESAPGAGEGAPPGFAAAAVAKLMLPRSLESEWYAYHAHPMILDWAIQSTGALLASPGAVRVRGFASIALVAGLGSDCVCRARRRRDPVPDARARTASETFVADLDFFDRKGAHLGAIRGLEVEALPVLAGMRIAAKSAWHRIEWVAAAPALLEVPREVDRFILVSDSEPNAAWLAAELEKQGAQVRFCEKVEDLEPLVRLQRATGDGRYGFLLLAWADRTAEGSPEPDFQRAFRVGQWASAIREHTADAAQIWIATRGLQPRAESAAGSEAVIEDPRLGSHVAREIDRFASCAEMQQCRLFDARPIVGEVDLLWLASLVGRPGDERQFMMASAGALVPRMAVVGEGDSPNGPGRAAARPVGDADFAVVATGREGRAAVAFHSCGASSGARGLGADEVAVDVACVGLSGFDVLMGLDLARRSFRTTTRAGDGGESQGNAREDAAGDRVLGLDFAGVVTAVGHSVRDLAVGDRVVGVRAGAAQRRLVVERARLARAPDHGDLATAVAGAWPELVARHVLDEVARLRAGERVLIVSAGGGIGLTLASHARARGAEVFATASTPARRAALLERGARVAPSEAAFPLDESTRFDLIIAADAGPDVHARLSRLAAGGRYVDLCPRERFEREELGALRLGANRAYLAVDCLSALEAGRDPIGSRLAAIGPASVADSGRAAVPFTVFPIGEAARALRFMTQNRHVGRVVLEFAQAAGVAVEATSEADLAWAASRRFVVSGGDGAGPAARLRSELADALRAGPASAVVEIAATAAAQGAAVDAWIHVCDESAADADDLRHRMAASGVADQVLISLREDVVGDADRDRAWEARLWVDRLVLADARGRGGRALGLSIGRDAKLASVLRVLGRIGQDGPRAGRDDQLVHLDPVERAERARRAPSPLLAALAEKESGAGIRAFDRLGYRDLTPPERRAAMLRHVVDELAGVLGLGAEGRERIDAGSRLDALGLDSLMTMELFMGLSRGLELPLTADAFPAGPNLSEIAQVLVRRLDAGPVGAAA